jgi:hypothetical protein
MSLTACGALPYAARAFAWWAILTSSLQMGSTHGSDSPHNSHHATHVYRFCIAVYSGPVCRSSRDTKRRCYCAVEHCMLRSRLCVVGIQSATNAASCSKPISCRHAEFNAPQSMVRGTPCPICDGGIRSSLWICSALAGQFIKLGYSVVCRLSAPAGRLATRRSSGGDRVSKHCRLIRACVKNDRTISIPQGLKPIVLHCFLARLKSCPDTKRAF